MRQKIKNTLKLGIGICISAFFLYLAFRQVDIHQLGDVLKNANGYYIIPAILAMFVSHWFRALRHRYLLAPIKRIESHSLFSALLIGYMANNILPAHLGELLRAYVIGKKEEISGSSTLATIAVERVLDVLSLLLIMGFVFIYFPFPDMVKLSAYLTFAFVMVIVGFLAYLKMKPQQTIRIVEIITKPFPKKIGEKILKLIISFEKGVVPLEDTKSYVMVFVHSIVIWILYAMVYAIGFYIFDFVEIYDLPLDASLVVLVITTIAVLVPSSPGYVGTYHYLCMISLTLFDVPESSALGYAIVVHAISMFPVALVGVGYALKEGIKISKIGSQKELDGIEM
jgi:uncharacterized protein (TIRG00374 family)